MIFKARAMSDFIEGLEERDDCTASMSVLESSVFLCPYSALAGCW